jgi:hypothetical protein
LDIRAVDQDSSSTEALGQNSSGSEAVENDRANIGAVEQDSLDLPRVDLDGSDTGPVEQDSSSAEAVERNISDIGAVEQNSLDRPAVDQDGSDTGSVEQESSGTKAVEQSSSDTSAAEQNSSNIGVVEQDSWETPRLDQDGLEHWAPPRLGTPEAGLRQSSSGTEAVEQSSSDTGAVEQNSSNIGAVEQNSLDRPAVDQHGSDTGLVEQDSSNIGAVERNSSDIAVLEQTSSDTEATVRLEAKMLQQATECEKQMEGPGMDIDGLPASGRANTTVYFKPWNKQMNMVRDSAAWGLKKPIRKMTNDRVNIAFLVFADDRIHNEEIWLHWMEGARAAGLEFSMHIHASGLSPNGTSEWRSERFKEFLVPEQAPAAWCRTWEAQMVLLTSALRDKQVTHMVTLSSDSVPVKPMTWIYDQTWEQPLSRFCVDDSWRDPWPKAEMWSMLRREDALFFHENRRFAERNFRHDCEDELAWYFPLRARWDNFKEQAPLKRECIMFANWKDGRQACREQWSVNADKCHCPTLRASKSTPASIKHPVAYHDVHADAFKELVRSPFWFARTFPEGAVPEKLRELLDPAPKPKKNWFGFLR